MPHLDALENRRLYLFIFFDGKPFLLSMLMCDCLFLSKLNQMLKSILPLLVLILVACTKGSFKSDGTYSVQLSKLRNNYLQTREVLFYNASNGIASLKTRTYNFYQANHLTNYNQLVLSWGNCRSTFLLTAPYWYGDNSVEIPGASVIHRMEMYPVDPAFLDYTTTNSNAGIINDLVNYPNLTAANLRLWNLQGGSQNVTCGMHAMEAMIWGEDNNASSGGTKPLADFQNQRRRQFLTSNISVLEDDFDEVKDQSTFKTNFLKLTPQQSFKFMITGLSEFVRVDFAQNSIKKSLDFGTDFYEVSRFSDNTFKDLTSKLNALRLALDPRELFIAPSDYYLIDFIKEVDSEMYDRIQANLSILEQNIAFQTMPFDQAILDMTKRQELQTAFEALIAIDNDLQKLKGMIK